MNTTTEPKLVSNLISLPPIPEEVASLINDGTLEDLTEKVRNIEVRCFW